MRAFLLLVAMAASVFAAFMGGVNNAFSFSATTLNSSTIVCIQGPVGLNEYIAIGIPPTQPNTFTVNMMINAAIAAVFPTAFGPMLIQGRGGQGVFVQSSNQAIATSLVPEMKSWYVNGTVRGCFGMDVVRDVSTFIWATGTVVNGSVQQHAPTGKGVARGVSLFDGVATSLGATSLIATSSIASAVVTSSAPGVTAAAMKGSELNGMKTFSVANGGVSGSVPLLVLVALSGVLF
ncbi:hypothetical protein HDU98_008489 [Podochytrium sp. JEL0797]|nr:hypothetical protein HDU98_008489 [Podochytrium sp. JEL0797]